MLKFGFHNFMNAQPVLLSLMETASQVELEMVVDIPASLADRMADGELDLAMIPSVEFLKAADRYRLLLDLCIASRGPVMTVLLVCRKPLEDVRTLVVDQRSRTSAALLDILFQGRWSPDLKKTKGAPAPHRMLEDNDAALIIGDQAFQVKNLAGVEEVYDLSQCWLELTGKSFVHAVVAVREGVTVTPAMRETIQQAKQQAPERAGAIARNLAQPTGIHFAVLEDYLTRKIIYDFGDAELEGFKEFQKQCLHHGILPAKHPIQTL